MLYIEIVRRDRSHTGDETTPGLYHTTLPKGCMCHALSGERDNYYGAVHRLQTLTSRGSCRTIIPPYILYTKEPAKIASSVPGWIRTTDPSFRKAVLYPTELREQMLMRCDPLV